MCSYIFISKGYKKGYKGTLVIFLVWKMKIGDCYLSLKSLAFSTIFHWISMLNYCHLNLNCKFLILKKNLNCK